MCCQNTTSNFTCGRNSEPSCLRPRRYCASSPDWPRSAENRVKASGAICAGRRTNDAMVGPSRNDAPDRATRGGRAPRAAEAAPDHGGGSPNPGSPRRRRPPGTSGIATICLAAGLRVARRIPHADPSRSRIPVWGRVGTTKITSCPNFATKKPDAHWRISSGGQKPEVIRVDGTSPVTSRGRVPD